jgi:hypothetical protein
MILKILARSEFKKCLIWVETPLTIPSEGPRIRTVGFLNFDGMNYHLS